MATDSEDEAAKANSIAQAEAVNVSTDSNAKKEPDNITNTEVKKFVRKRASIKSKITMLLKFAEQAGGTASDVCISDLKNLNQQVENYDETIMDIYLESDDKNLNEKIGKELSDQTNYSLNLKTSIKLLEAKRGNTVAASAEPPVLSKSNDKMFDVKLPVLHCPTFDGEGSDSLEYFKFRNSFNNVVGSRTRLDDSTKMTYLVSFLRGYAFKTVQHLKITDRNYTIALEILEREFLNKPALIDKLLKKLMSLKPEFDHSYLKTKIYINEFKCILSDLKEYEVDLTADNACIKLISHIMFSNLPVTFQHELILKIDDSYPSYTDVFDNYIEIIRKLNLKSEKYSAKIESNGKGSKEFKSHAEKSGGKANDNKSVFQNSALAANNRRNCKFCNSSNHTMLRCDKYKCYQPRIDRCRSLKICEKCSSPQHATDKCDRKLDYPCKFCKKDEHISALCPTIKTALDLHFSMNSTSHDETEYVFPTLTIDISRGTSKTSCRCLVDTGSTRSYVHENVLNRISYPKDRSMDTFKIKNFLNKDNEALYSLSELSLNIDLCDGLGSFQLPMMVDDKFDLSYNVPHFDTAIKNLKESVQLADSAYFDQEGNSVVLEGILGIDAIQHFKDFKLVDCLRGKAFSYAGGLMPFGSIENFWTAKETKNFRQQEFCSQPRGDSVNKTDHINFVLNPVGCVADPFSSINKDSMVEGHLEKLHDLESLGIRDESALATSDNSILEEFDNSIELRNNRYHVNIPWYTDKINNVKPNFHLARAILDRVVTKLNKLELYDSYDAIFQDQLSKGILEELPTDELDVNAHVWVPHRPVVKEGDQITTKVRPVLNCSLKVNDSPSLNEAVFPGLNLMQDLLTLLIKVRMNDYLVMADISKAFLQIRLNSEEDKNRFSVLWQDKTGKLVAYRYNTIVFGGAASPFILNHVIKKHLLQYPPDFCSNVLNNNMYIDNLYYTGNSVNELSNCFKKVCDRMKEGGFDMRSWSSNNPILLKEFEDNNCGTNHQNPYEKVLGYEYAPADDKIRVATPVFVASDAITKRKVLSCVSKIFDPLGLYSPVTVRSKLFLRKIWSANLSWDQPLTEELLTEWNKLDKDLNGLQSISFDRKVAANGPAKLVIFTDSSKDIYGFTAFVVVGGDNPSSNLLFAKCKLSPLKRKSLPTLELLAVFLAFKCLDAILSGLTIDITDIIFCIDAQICISWILTEMVKTKNIFARNRVRDISDYRKQIKSRLNIDCKFKFVPTELNVADLLTRGLSLNLFSEKIQFWSHGPEFLTDNVIRWPERQLGCLSPESQLMVLNCAVISVQNPIIDLNRYSNLNQLFRITALLFRIINKLRKRSITDSENFQMARNYWLKTEQAVHFSKELSFLNDQSNSNPPLLVNNLNLFLDDNGIIRSRGKLDKCLQLSYDVRNPIVIPKNSHLTELIIADCHIKCKHLGSSSTLNYIRNSGLWIPQGRTAVSKIVKQCISCRRYNAVVYRYPKPSDYHKDKVNFIKPFDNTGVDFTGHVYVKFGEKFVKMYLVVYTCLSVRAVHIDLIPSMNCSDFLASFVRFCNAFCHPSCLYSDNAPTFIQAATVLQNSSLDNNLSEFLLINNIKFVRIPLYSAWFGSAWERMIKVIKSCLYKTIGRQRLDYFRFITLLSDIQNAINSRPLTYRDTSDLSLDILSPNSFLKLQNSNSLVFGEISASAPRTEASHKQLNEFLTKREELFSHFRDEWYENYLLSLRETNRDLYQDGWINKIKVGDIVLINSPIKTRPFWQMGRVIKLHRGSDGCVRSVTVIRSDRSEANHAISHLYPMELSLSSVSSDVSATDDTVQPAAVQSPPRPRRRAATAALEKISRV